MLEPKKKKKRTALTLSLYLWLSFPHFNPHTSTTTTTVVSKKLHTAPRVAPDKAIDYGAAARVWLSRILHTETSTFYSRMALDILVQALTYSFRVFNS